MRRIKAAKTPSDIFKLMRTDSSRQENVVSTLSHEGRLIAHQGRPSITAPSLGRSPVTDLWLRKSSPNERRYHKPGSSGMHDRLLKQRTRNKWRFSGFTESLLESHRTICRQTLLACINLSMHPSCFKLVEVVFLFNKTGVILYLWKIIDFYVE